MLFHIVFAQNNSSGNNNDHSYGCDSGCDMMCNHTLLKTNIDPDNGPMEDYYFPLPTLYIYI